MAAGRGAQVRAGTQDSFATVKKRDLDRLTTEVMQLREFLPRVLNRDLIEMLYKAREAQKMKVRLVQEQERLRQECRHLQSRLDAALSQCQKEREEKLKSREQLVRCEAELQQQADFCSDLGTAACGLLWSSSARDNTVTHWLADGTLQPFLTVATQTLESFIRSLDEEVKTQTEDSHQDQFVLAVAGTIANIAAVTGGRDFLSVAAHILLATLMKLLQRMKPGVFPKLKVLILMALYNVSISIRGLQYVSKNQELLPLIQNLLEDSNWEVCLHALRLLQSVMLEEEVLLLLSPSLLDPELEVRVRRLTSSKRPSLRTAAEQSLQDLQDLQQRDQGYGQKGV
ncbi:heat shock factor 2-binding protein [Antennarius striatus]|uniref:heat shock factor 2-binding protein n=1 Tax=Antennarius striatus TaxID=241820 RepID=UPI0035B38E76